MTTPISTPGRLAKSLPLEPPDTEALEDVPTYRFTSIRSLRKYINLQIDELMADGSNQQYIVFEGVTKENFDQIDRLHRTISKGMRKTYYADRNLLIIKLRPLQLHQTPELELVQWCFIPKLYHMGITYEMTPLGGATFYTPNSAKKGDSSYRPRSSRTGQDWPTLVFQGGESQSLRLLRSDARWWLTHSGGEVKIVVSISVSRADKCIRIERWCLAQAGSAPRPNTRACPNGNISLPRMVQEITITPNITAAEEGTTAQSGEGASAIGSYTVTGAPLILPFEDMFLRPLVQQEHDIVLTAADLLEYATGLWLGM